MMPVITRDSIPTDKEVKRLLLDRDNIPVLEEVLDRESGRFRHLEGLKNYTPPRPTFKEIFSDTSKLHFGPRLDADELREEFQKVKGKVDRILGVRESSPTITGGRWSPSPIRNGIYTTGVAAYVAPFIPLDLIAFIPDPTDPITTPLIRAANIALLPVIYLLRGSYNPRRERIRIPHFISKRTNAIPTLAHEYAHHVQNRRLHSAYFEHRAFMEGHANGVGRAVARRYSELEDNEAFEYDTLNSTVDELKNTYRWMCKKLGLTPSKSLTKGLANPFLDVYDLGTAFFRILEAQQGPDVYRRALRPA